MSDTFDWRIIDRELAGEASSEDDAALRRWLAEDPRHAELLRALRSAAEPNAGKASDHWNVDAAWARLSTRVDGIRSPRPIGLRPAHAAERAPASRSLRQRIAVVTTTLAAASLVALLWQSSTTPESHRVARVGRREVVAANGQQTRVTLHDGTRVVLNAGSRLRYSPMLGSTPRDVELEGEGYFDVVHDASRPFRVHARGNVAEDIGTRFVVRAYRDSRNVEVVVEEGRVSLKRDRVAASPAMLDAGQLGRVELDGSVTVVDSADVERWLSWTHGVLVLDGLSLAEAAVEIGRRFDAHVVVEDPALAQRRVSARFRSEPLRQVLDALTTAMGAQWARDGNRIVISRAER